MVRITETLIRKRAEHNNLEISTLEEVSLHQQDIERIEFIDKWCRDLKILYLQSNLIPKIENVGRLKKLEYLNLALNNIEKIENLERCESLKKLDLTVNFIGELTSIECLQGLVHFEELFLTGNPCADYEGFREYVIATLPKLKRLDGIEVEKSERIKAVQELNSRIIPKILEQQEAYKKKRERQKLEAASKTEEKKDGLSKGQDGRWYTDINDGDSERGCPETEDSKKTKEENDDDFWQEKVPYTPESRVEVHEHLEKQRRKEEKQSEKNQQKRQVRLQTDDGRVLNVNEAKINFCLTEEEEENRLKLEVNCYKHLDTSLIDVDVQPTYVKVLIKGKVLQLVLSEEVLPDSSTAQRSQTTGHLVITMPKAKEVVIPKSQKKPLPNRTTVDKARQIDNSSDQTIRPVSTHLEVDPSQQKVVDLSILTMKDTFDEKKQEISKPAEKLASKDFIDDPDVPPLI